MSKRPVIFCLAVSVGLHVAVLGLPSVFDRIGEIPRRVEIGLASWPPQAAGRRSAPAENGAAASAPAPENRKPARTDESPSRHRNAPVAQRRPKTPLPPSITPTSPVSSHPAVRPDSPVEAFTPSPQAFPGPLAEATPSASPDEPAAALPPPGAPAPENPSEADLRGKGRASVSTPLVEAVPRYDRNAPPPYPRLARERGWEGEVLLRVVVTEGGRVRQVTVERSSGHDLLDTTALRAVRRWRFHPSRLGATPVEGEVRVPVRFELRES